MRKKINVWDTLYDLLNDHRVGLGMTWNSYLKFLYNSYMKKEREHSVFRKVVKEELEEIKKRLTEVEMKVIELEERNV